MTAGAALGRLFRDLARVVGFQRALATYLDSEALRQDIEAANEVGRLLVRLGCLLGTEAARAIHDDAVRACREAGAPTRQALVVRLRVAEGQAMWPAARVEA